MGSLFPKFITSSSAKVANSAKAILDVSNLSSFSRGVTNKNEVDIQGPDDRQEGSRSLDDRFQRANTSSESSDLSDDSLFRGAVEIVTADGDRIWVATDNDAEKQIPHEAVYFTCQEVFYLKQAGKEVGRAALLVKLVFGNEAIVISTNKETRLAGIAGERLEKQEKAIR
jgi:hypothetical protein